MLAAISLDRSSTFSLFVSLSFCLMTLNSLLRSSFYYLVTIIYLAFWRVSSILRRAFSSSCCKSCILLCNFKTSSSIFCLFCRTLWTETPGKLLKILVVSWYTLLSGVWLSRPWRGILDPCKFDWDSWANPWLVLRYWAYFYCSADLSIFEVVD